MIDIGASQIETFAIYEESEILVLAVKLKSGFEIGALIFQMERATSDIRSDAWGAHVEIDDMAGYGMATAFRVDSEANRLVINLEPDRSGGLAGLRIELPEELDGQSRKLLRLLEAEFLPAQPTRP